MAEIKPTTLFLGKKANQLLKIMAEENGIASRFFFTKIIIREARAEATALSSDKMKERLNLINEVNDELVEIINDPPKEMLADRDYSTNPKSIYAKVWDAHKRLEQRGWSEEEIHDYCLTRYGMDFDISKTPSKNPKNNPDWVGGGTKAKEIKKAREESRKIKVQDGQ